MTVEEMKERIDLLLEEIAYNEDENRFMRYEIDTLEREIEKLER